MAKRHKIVQGLREAIAAAKVIEKFRRERVPALVEAAISVCEPENADERATNYTREVLTRKFNAILGGN